MFVRTELNFDELQMTKEKPEFIIRMGNTVELVVTVAVTGKRRYCNATLRQTFLGVNLVAVSYCVISFICQMI